MNTSGLSAWCTPAVGVLNHKAQCRMCEAQMEKRPGMTCSCVDHEKKKAD